MPTRASQSTAPVQPSSTTRHRRWSSRRAPPQYPAPTTLLPSPRVIATSGLWPRRAAGAGCGRAGRAGATTSRSLSAAQAPDWPEAARPLAIRLARRGGHRCGGAQPHAPGRQAHLRPPKHAQFNSLHQRRLRSSVRDLTLAGGRNHQNYAFCLRSRIEFLLNTVCAHDTLAGDLGSKRQGARWSPNTDL